MNSSCLSWASSFRPLRITFRFSDYWLDFARMTFLAGRYISTPQDNTTKAKIVCILSFIWTVYNCIVNLEIVYKQKSCKEKIIGKKNLWLGDCPIESLKVKTKIIQKPYNSHVIEGKWKDKVNDPLNPRKEPEVRKHKGFAERKKTSFQMLKDTGWLVSPGDCWAA